MDSSEGSNSNGCISCLCAVLATLSRAMSGSDPEREAPQSVSVIEQMLKAAEAMAHPSGEAVC